MTTAEERIAIDIGRAIIRIHELEVMLEQRNEMIASLTKQLHEEKNKTFPEANHLDCK